MRTELVLGKSSKWIIIPSDSQPAMQAYLRVKKYADNLKGVERAEDSMMKELKDYATEVYLQPG